MVAPASGAAIHVVVGEAFLSAQQRWWRADLASSVLARNALLVVAPVVGAPARSVVCVAFGVHVKGQLLGVDRFD